MHKGTGVLVSEESMRQIKSKLSWGLFCALALYGLTASVHAASFLPKNFDELVGEAEQIFVGVVVSAQPRQQPAGAIVTDVSFGGIELLKGTVAEGYVLTVLGGEIGGQGMEIAGVPKFQPGARYLVFVTGNGQVFYPFVGGDQGVFQVRDDVTGTARVYNGFGGPSAIAANAQAAALQSGQISKAPFAQPQPADPVSLDAFKAVIRSRLGR